MAEVLYNTRILAEYYKLRVRWENPNTVKPGQFVMLRIPGCTDPLLRRPFGIYRLFGRVAAGERFILEVLYKVVGKGTRLMTGLKSGDTIDILGPLGNGFPLKIRNQKSEVKSQKIIMVAGGIGIVPFYLLAQKLRNPHLLFGGKSKDDLPGLGDFKKLDIKMDISTEDGSIGKRGLVTDLLLEKVTKHSVVYACGPKGMLKEVAGVAHKARVPCYVSLDQVMACGIGACLGCAVKIVGGKREVGCGQSKTTSYLLPPASQIYKMVCKDGPVFDAKEIAWEEV